MARANAKGATFITEGTQKLQLANFWGTGKTFTMNDLRNDLDIASPAARLLELKEAGFNVKASAIDSGAVGRLRWNIPSKKKSILIFYRIRVCFIMGLSNEYENNLL